MMENDVLTMRICKDIIGSNWFLRITEKGRNHTVSLFFSIFYDISNELRSTDFP